MRRINWCKKPEMDLRRARICWKAGGRDVKDDKLADLATLTAFLSVCGEDLADKFIARVRPQYARLWPRLSGGAVCSAVCRAVEHGYLRVGIENGRAVFGTTRSTNAVVERVIKTKINWIRE